MIVAVSGIRDLAAASFVDVETAVIKEATQADTMRFGGAIGVDTVALAALCNVSIHKTVIVPYRLDDQPHEAAVVVRRCANETLEMNLPRSRSAYLRRNDALLKGADRLLAFSDGRQTGGTSYTIRKAKALGLHVVVVAVLGKDNLNTARPTRVYK